MSSPTKVMALLIFLFRGNLLALAQSVCPDNGNNYTQNSTYSANLYTALSSLSTNVDSNGFSNVSVGQSPDRVYAIAFCRGDLQQDNCRLCIRDAHSELQRSCPYRKQAVNMFELCTVRYSDETIFGTMMTAGGFWYWNSANITSLVWFEENLRRLINNLRNQAAYGGSERKVAADYVHSDFETIYALLQCSPDLSPNNCNDCLIKAADLFLPKCCLEVRGARVFMPSCNIRYKAYTYYNETRLKESITVPAPLPGKNDGNKTRTVIIVVVVFVVSMILAVPIGILLRRRIKQKPKEKLIEIGEAVDGISRAESLQYAFSTIKAVTNDFSDNNKLGQGGFGAVYKGKLPNGQEIAVKRLSRYSGQGDLQFKNEVELLAKLQHRNLVRLLGFSLEGSEKLLVYEFVQNASLDLFIFDPIRHSSLDWNTRYKIIEGIAKGILYLHVDSRLRIIHRDLKASNILLDGEMNSKIADFGVARLFGHDETQASTSRIVGTYGYMAPEYAMHGHFSTKSDVFSFGVLILEIISGQKNNCFRSRENVEDLLSFTWKNWQEGTTANVVDPFLRSDSSSMSDILRCIHIGLLCVQENPTDRPKMASVVSVLSNFTLTLAVPSEPAFYLPGGYDSDVPLVQENNSSNSYRAVISDNSSNNDASITELYPR